tara:strand:+ start:4099 stop:5373 length:1275 start_codon:yes stop_codon:yes gene_type:complete
MVIMENIIEPTDNFDFSQFSLESPSPLQGGNFFTKLNFSDKKLPVYVQLPKCLSKHGIVKNGSSKKCYIDLMFKYFDSHLLTWFENLEIKCRELIFSKSDQWFQSEIELDDIENMFISSTKSYKSGKFITLRAHIPHTKQIKKDYCMIYDENERILDTSSITETTELIPLICIDGIKFSSKSFQLDINLPQIMVLSIQDEIKNGFMIKHQERKENSDNLEKEKTVDNKELDEKELDKKQIQSKNLNKNESDEKESDNKECGKKEKDNKELNNKELDDNELDNKELDDSSIVKKNYNEATIDSKKNFKLLESDRIIDNNVLLARNENIENIENDKNNQNLEIISNSNTLQEVNLDLENDDIDTISLKKPEEVYYEIYRAAREKAKHMKQSAIKAYLEAKNIKTKYMLEEINNSEDEISNFSEIEE